MSTTTLNRVQYSGLDFLTIEDEILNRIQLNFATTYNDFANSSLGIMLIDIFSFGLDTLSFYLDRRATDLFLVTARSQKSVARAARQLGYKMAPATASSVNIFITPLVSNPFVVTLPIGFQLKSPDGTFWEAGQSYSWPANNTTTQELTFSQTRTLQAIFTSDGTPNQVFTIANIPTDEFLVGPGSDGVSQVTVLVNGIAWTENSLLTFGQTNQFEIGYHDDPPTLRFGDGTAGNIPPANAQISLTFKSSRGTAGQVTSGQRMVAVTPLSVSFTTINFNYVITTGSGGGSDPETIDKAKANAPSFFASRGVNITAQDYNVRASSFADSVFGSIAAATAVSVRSASSDAVLQTLVNNIVSTSEEYTSTVASGVATADTSFNAATAAMTAATANSSAISSDVTTLTTSVNSATSANKSAALSSGIITSFVSQITSNANTLSTDVSAITIGGSDSLTSGTASTLLGLIAAIQSAANQCSTQSSSITSNTGLTSTSLAAMSSALTDITAQQSSLSTNITTAQGDITTGETALATLITNVNNIQNNVESYGQQIIEHVGNFLSSDCQSNLVQVPILTLDSDGFYVAPSIALVQSLQSYLDANKEITQVVEVFAATNLLIPAAITVHVGILTGYSTSVITSQISALILTVLKKRPFGKNLKLSELYWVLAPEGVSAIPGVDFVDVVITGPVPNLDANGNLVVASNQVVTRGTIAVTFEVVT